MPYSATGDATSRGEEPIAESSPEPLRPSGSSHAMGSSNDGPSDAVVLGTT